MTPETVDPALLALARAAGAHALAGFCVLLIVVTGAVLAASRLVERYGVSRETSRISARTRLFVYFSLSFLLIAGAGALFAAIADEIGAGETLPILDQAFSSAVGEALPPGVVRTFAWITHLGDPWVLTAWCIGGALVLLLSQRRLLAFGLVLAIAGNGLLNTTLKHIFERARPVHDVAVATASGWSFPSGHTSGSLVTYGMLAYVLLRTLPPRWHVSVLVAASVVAVTTASSRVFLRVHFASDVLAGFASGTAWLVASIVSIEMIRRAPWRMRKPVR